MISGAIVCLYIWSATNSNSIVGLPVAGLAAISAAIAIATLVRPPAWRLTTISGVMYSALVIACGTLTYSTGGLGSPFIALWMIVAVLAGIFGLYGLVGIGCAALAYSAQLAIMGLLTQSHAVPLAIVGILPLAISYMIWHDKFSSDAGNHASAYQALTSELSQVASKAEVVINAISDGVIALDSKGIIQLINPAAQHLIGWEKRDAIQLDYRSVLKIIDKAGKAVEDALNPIVQVLSSNKPIATREYMILTNSGKRLSVSIVISPVGQVGAGVIVVFRDITKELQEEREQAEFISTASHEMRTPVASIEGYLGLALNPATATIDDKARDFITKAHQSAQHLGRLFQDLLDVSKAEDKRLTNRPQLIDAVAFVSNIAEGLKPKATEKGLTLLCNPHSEISTAKHSSRTVTPVFYIYVDSDHLNEVVSNLLDNAIKYTQSGTIMYDISGDNDHVRIGVSDTGIGIPAEDMPHLFQKFYRVDNSDTREIGGTGLGLYLSRMLTESMGGRIWAESRLKQGSAFYIEFPRVEHAEAMKLLEKASSASDESLVASAMQRYLSQPSGPIGTLTPSVPQTVINTPNVSQLEMQGVTPLSAIEQDPQRYIREHKERVIPPPR